MPQIRNKENQACPDSRSVFRINSRSGTRKIRPALIQDRFSGSTV
jgi:hypothetical protein